MKSYKIATFAGGCFWCVESTFKGTKGVTSVSSGYMGGHAEDPTYEQVCSGTTGHAEVVQLTFDPEQVSYDTLLGIFLRQIDPTDKGGSFLDRGSQYRPEIFVHDPEQKAAALAMIDAINKSKLFDTPVAVDVTPASTFYPAEDYHQNYHLKHPLRYRIYRAGSGRDRFIENVWAKGGDLHEDQSV